MERSTSIDFLEFTEKDRKRLLEAYFYLRSSFRSVLEGFYRSLESIDAGPQNYGVDPESLISRQIEHWHRLFAGTFDEDYETSARKIAIQHYEVGLPHDLYAQSYLKILTLLHGQISLAPGLDRAQAREMKEAVTKAIGIDIGIALSPYSGDLI